MKTHSLSHIFDNFEPKLRLTTTISKCQIHKVFNETKKFLGQPISRHGKQYFVHFDNRVTGGRWYEADIYDDSNGKYGFSTHDGSDRKRQNALEIAKLGEQSEKGDPVLSYYKDKIFAMPGVHMETKTNEAGKVLILVKYNDASSGEEWEDASYVHKLVTLQSILDGTFLNL